IWRAEPVIAKVGLALDGYAVDLEVAGEPAARRLPLKRLLAERLDWLWSPGDPIALAGAEVVDDDVVVELADGRTARLSGARLVGHTKAQDSLDVLVQNAGRIATMAPELGRGPL